MRFPKCPRVASVIRILVLSGILTTVLSAQHPRLMVDPADLTPLPGLAAQEPWRSMLEANERKVTNLVSYPDRPSTYAALAIFDYEGIDGDKDRSHWAVRARMRTLSLISDTSRWANLTKRSLSRGIDCMHVSNAFDLLYNEPEWAAYVISAQEEMTGSATNPAGVYGDHIGTVPAEYVGLTVNEAVSLALKLNADSLIASGGSGWPGNTKVGNNWFAVRYAGAAYAYLACDEPEAQWADNFTEAVAKLQTYLDANLTRSSLSQGWNPEGFNYNLFPGWHTYPFAYAYKRLRGVDLTQTYPGMRYSLWSLYAGVLPIWTQGDQYLSPFRGLHPDVSDDNPVLAGEGSTTLAFLFAPDGSGGAGEVDYRPGIKWIARRLFGDLANQGDPGPYAPGETFDAENWDSCAGNGLYSLLFFPADLPEQNPADVWGLIYRDPVYGIYAFRNRWGAGDQTQSGDDTNFHDFDKDTVCFVTANIRGPSGGHSASDTLSFRITGLGVPWAVGSGRTTATEPQTILFPSDPNRGVPVSSTFGEEIIDEFIRPAGGDGYVIMGAQVTDSGVRNQVRRIITDYSDAAGVEGLWVISDSCDEVNPWWRLCTISGNQVDVSTPGEFIITSAEGHRMVGKVWTSDGNPVQCRTGLVRRGSSYPVSGASYIDNRYVDFESGEDGESVVALALVKAGEPMPVITISRAVDGTFSVFTQAGTSPGRTVLLQDNTVTVEGWDPPVVTVTSPLPNQSFNSGLGENTSISVSGTASAFSGKNISRIKVFLNESLLTEESFSAASVNWGPYPLPAMPVGEHSLRIIASDNEQNDKSVQQAFRVNYSYPPELTLSSPGIDAFFVAGQDIVFRGSIADGDGIGDIQNIAVSVTEFKGYQTLGSSLGDAVIDAATGTWSKSWTSVPSGRYEVRVTAYDAHGDITAAQTLPIRVNEFFTTGQVLGTANFYYGARYGYTGDYQIRYQEGERVVFTAGGDFRNQSNDFIGSANRRFPDFELNARVKVEVVDGQLPAYALFFGSGLIVDLRMAGEGTRIHRTDTQYQDTVLPALSPAIGGVPYLDDWFEVTFRRVDDRATVLINGTPVIDGTNPWNATNGDIGWGFVRSNYSRIFYDDVELIVLDEQGDPLQDTPPTILFNAPILFADLPAGQPVALDISMADPEGIEQVELYAGSALLGEAVESGGTWQFTWQPQGRGDIELRAVVTDGQGSRTTSAPQTVKVTATGGAGGNGAPLLAVTTPAANTDVAGGALQFKGTASDPEGRLLGVQLVMDGEILGATVVRNGEWSFSMPYVYPGLHDFEVIAFDEAALETAVSLPSINVLARDPAATMRINFQPSSAPVVNGTLIDIGRVLDLQENGETYGFSSAATVKRAQDPDSPSDLYDTYAEIGTKSWEIQLPAGNYAVRAVAGDPAVGATPVQQVIQVQGASLIDGTISAASPWIEGTVSAPVPGGTLVITGGTASTKLCFIEILPLPGGNLLPLAQITIPANGSVFDSGLPGILMEASAVDDVSVDSVDFLINGSLAGTDSDGSDGWSYDWPAPADGLYTLTARATDTDGATGFESPPVTITVGVPPVASFTATPTTGQVPVLISVDAAASYDSDGTIANYQWDFGDGSALVSGPTAVQASHTYTSVGSFTITLTVTDDRGTSTSATRVVTPFTLGPQSTPMFAWGSSGSPNYRFRDIAPTFTHPDFNGDSIPDSVATYPFSLTLPLNHDRGYTDIPVYGAVQGVVLSTLGDANFNAAGLGSHVEIRFQTAGNQLELLMFWVKEDFGLNGDVLPVYFDRTSSLNIWDIDHFEYLGDGLRWVVREGDQFYVSQILATRAAGADEMALTFASDSSDGFWAPYDPVSEIDFDQDAAVFAEHNFSNITAAGFLIDTDDFTNSRRWVQFSNFAMVASTLEEVDDFASWASNAGLPPEQDGPDDDFDRDGLSHAFERLLQLSPTSRDNPGQYLVRMMPDSEGDLVFSFEYAAPIPADMQLYYDFSRDLVNWEAEGATSLVGPRQTFDLGEGLVRDVFLPNLDGASPVMMRITVTVDGW